MKTPEQEARALAQREANAEARRRGEALPYPNLWDFWDPTKARSDPKAREESFASALNSG